MSRGKIQVGGRWDYPFNSPRKKYSKKYYYWFAEGIDENTGDKITCAPSYKELGKFLGDIMQHEILYYQATPGLTEAIKRRSQLYNAMSLPIRREIKNARSD